MGNDHSRPSKPRRLTAVVGLACIAQNNAFAPIMRPSRQPAFVNKPCPQFLYLGEEDNQEGVPLDTTAKEQNDIIPPPSLNADDAWAAKMELEMEMTMSDLERELLEGDEMNDGDPPSVVQQTKVKSNKRVKNQASKDIDNKDDDGVILPIQMELEFEQVAKNLDAALDEFNELETKPASVPLEERNGKPYFITEGRLSYGYDDDNNNGDDGNDDEDDSFVSSLPGEAVDSTVGNANTVELPFFASSAVKSTTKKRAPGPAKTQGSNTTEALSVTSDYSPGDSETLSVAKPPKLSGQSRPFAFRRSFLGARPKSEKVTPTPSNDKSERALRPSDEGKRRINAFLAAAKDQKLATEALRNAQDEEKIHLLRLEEITELAKETLRLTDEKKRLNRMSALEVSARKENVAAKAPGLSGGGAQRETDSKDATTFGRPTFIIQSGKKPDEEQRLPSISSLNGNGDSQQVPSASRPTFVIQSATEESPTEQATIPRTKVPRPPKEAPPVIFDFFNRHDELSTVSSPSTMAHSLTYTSAQNKGIIALSDEKDAATVGDVVSHVSKAAFSGGRAAFFTFGAVWEAARSPPVVSSVKDASESIAASIKSISEAIADAAEVEKFAASTESVDAQPIADAADGYLFLEVAKGVGNVAASVGDVGEAFIRSFGCAVQANGAFASVSDTTKECISIVTTLTAFGMKQVKRAVNSFGSIQTVEERASAVKEVAISALGEEIGTTVPASDDTAAAMASETPVASKAQRRTTLQEYIPAPTTVEEMPKGVSTDPIVDEDLQSQKLVVQEKLPLYVDEVRVEALGTAAEVKVNTAPAKEKNEKRSSHNSSVSVELNADLPASVFDGTNGSAATPKQARSTQKDSSSTAEQDEKDITTNGLVGTIVTENRRGGGGTPGGVARRTTRVHDKETADLFRSMFHF